jgi:hypothetical protein
MQLISEPELQIGVVSPADTTTSGNSGAARENSDVDFVKKA